MKDYLNAVENSKLIKITDYELVFVEDFTIVEEHPASSYYFKVSDLSINLQVSLKWVLWGYFFLDSIRVELVEGLAEMALIREVVLESKTSIKAYSLYLDTHEVSDIKDLLEGEYKKFYYDPNDKVRLKLVLTLEDFLLINFLLKPLLAKTNNT